MCIRTNTPPVSVLSIPFDDLPEALRNRMNESQRVTVRIGAVGKRRTGVVIGPIGKLGSLGRPMSRAGREDHSFGRRRKLSGAIDGKTTKRQQRSKASKAERKKEQNREAATR